MALRQELLLKQQGRLLPQQIIEQELLQLNMIALEQYINQIIEENPALEKIDNEEIDEVSKEEDSDIDDEYPEEYTVNDDGEYEERNPAKEYNPETGYIDAISSENETSAYGYLSTQIGQLHLSRRQQQIADQIVGNIDEKGFLKTTTRSIVDYFLLYLNETITLKEVDEILIRIQKELDPPGIASRSLAENLLIQLKRKYTDYQTDELNELAQRMIDKYFHLFSTKNYEGLIKKLEITKNQLSRVFELVESLNPSPLLHGGNTKRLVSHSIIPDFGMFWRNEKLDTVVHQKYIPKMRVNKNFISLRQSKMSSSEEKAAKMFIHKNVQQAHFFIEAIKMRFDTLNRIIKAIARKQVNYLKAGDETALVPMLLKDIAIPTGRDVSTISRSLAGKYIETDWGIKPVKFFFNQAIISKDSDEYATHYNVEQIMLDIIDQEDSSNPYTDEEITKLIAQKGFHLSRRTILSYREKLNILPSKARRKL